MFKNVILYLTKEWLYPIVVISKSLVINDSNSFPLFLTLIPNV